MLTKIATFLLLVTMAFLQGCTPVPPDKKIENIVRIFMHEPGRYTVLTQESATSTIVEQRVPQGNSTSATYVSDVPEGQPMWLMAHSKSMNGFDVHTDIVFHIHSVQDISGAGWNHRKFGSGQTNVIQ